MPHHITLEDIRVARDPDQLLTLLRKLGYRVEPQPLPLPAADLGFPPGAGIERLYLLADHGRLQVLLAELPGVRLSNLAPLARDLLARGGHYLLVATPGPPPYERVVFVQPRRIGQGLQLTVGIRRLVVEPAHPTRHDLDVLEAIAAHGSVDDPDALFNAHLLAFDVERLTNRFYRAYSELFQQAAGRVQQWNPGHRVLAAPEGSRAFTQRLLSRLMFLYFLQRKGWLAGNAHFLTDQYRRVLSAGDGYWHDCLRPLFFDTLNRRRVGDGSPWGDIPYLNGGLFEPAPPDDEPDVYLPNELFDPYAESGLLNFLNSYNFTVAEDTPLDQEVALDPEMLGKVFENLLEEAERGQSGTFYTPRAIVHYLARSALRLYLSDATGWPPERVALTLSGFCEASEVSETVAQHPVGTEVCVTPAEAARLETALRAIRVLDPAVGSGAFLVGMLHELVAARRLCWRAQGHTGTPPIAAWKRDFIAHSLYGVDIKPAAVEIARLRLWLSLVVDQTRAELEPLPNLDYRLMVGDSLLETLDGTPVAGTLPAAGTLRQAGLPGLPTPAEQLGLGLGETGRAHATLAELKEQYFTAQTRPERDRLRQNIQAQERQLALAGLDDQLAELEAQQKWLVARGSQVNWRGMAAEQRELERLADRQTHVLSLKQGIRPGQPLPFFAFRLHFFEVFRERGGFDVVLANPPYVRQELITAQKPALQRAYPHVYHGVADLYVYFYARGFELLRPGGALAYISSNKFMRAGYGKTLRAFLATQTTLETLIDFGDLPVFEASAYPCIVVARKAQPPADHAPRALTVHDLAALERLDEALHAAWRQPQAALRSTGWTLGRPAVLRLADKLRAAGRPLEVVVGGRILWGVKTGLNEAFVIDAATCARLIEADPHSTEIIKPWLRGRDVKRWRVEWAEHYLIWSYLGVDIQRYPAVLEHLAQFRAPLAERWEPRHGQCQWYELRPCDYYAEFERPKIVWPDIAQRCEFALDDRRLFPDATLFMIPDGELSLLGVLNSHAIEWFYRSVSPTIQREFLRFKRVYLSQIPIPDAPPGEQEAIERCVRRLLALRGAGDEAAALEAELNARVYRLFGLTAEEIAVIEEEARA